MEEKKESNNQKDREFVKEFKDRFKSAESHAKKWRKEARQCYDFTAGKQLTDSEIAEYEELLKAPIVFNRIDPYVSAVIGHQINNRQEIRFIPREPGDAKLNELYTSAGKFVDEESDSLEEVTEAFWDLVVTGMGWTDTYMDYADNPDGDVQGAERISPLEMSWDPSAIKRNLADARYRFHWKWWNKEDAKEKWPEIEDITPTEDNLFDASEDEGEEHDASRAWMYENDQSKWFDKDKDMIFIVRYQYYEMEDEYRIGDPASNRVLTWSKKKFEKFRDELDNRGIRYIKQQRRKYKQAFMLGEHILENGPAPCEKDFTLQCMTGKRDENKSYWYGLVRSMIDPQKWGNKFFSEIQDIMASNRTGGAFVESSALVDPRKAEDDWNSPNPLIEVADGALAAGRIQERNPMQYPAGIDRMMEFAISSLPQVSGLNMEMMGMVDRNQPGILEASRKRSAMSILSSLFDSLRLHQKKRGRILLYFIDEYISDGRLIKVVGQEGAQYVPLRKTADTQYDVIVSESPQSPDQRNETFAILAQIVPLAIQMGIPMPPDVLDYMPLPSTLTEKWKQMLQGQQQDPMAQQQQQLNMQEQQAKIKKDESVALLNEVKAMVEQVNAQLKQQTEPYKIVSQMVKQ